MAVKNLTDNPDPIAWAEEARRTGLVPEGTSATADLGGGFTLRVDRRWLYASVRLSPPLPVGVGIAVNATPHDDVGSKYSGTSKTLGAVARVDGFAGGRDAAAIREHCAEGVWFWHVDTEFALRALVTTLRTVVAGLDAAACAAEHRRLKTEAFAIDCAALADRSTYLGQFVIDALHNDETLDGTHPEIVALRAKFPIGGAP